MNHFHWSNLTYNLINESFVVVSTWELKNGYFCEIFLGVEALEIYWERREYAEGGHKDAGA